MIRKYTPSNTVEGKKPVSSNLPTSQQIARKKKTEKLQQIKFSKMKMFKNDKANPISDP